MDDQRDDRKGRWGIMRPIRLAALMIVGAGIGDLPRVGNFNVINEERIPRVVFGALCGLGVEMAIRAISEK
jgi:hypothetical protein